VYGDKQQSIFNNNKKKKKMGGRGRGRGNRSPTQRKHFRDGRENVWKRHKSDSASSDPNSNRNSENKTHWQPFTTQSPGFDEYYEVILASLLVNKEWFFV
jgi:multisite-specific tRNA:(cytosine-C5)-methyltransferase